MITGITIDGANTMDVDDGLAAVVEGKNIRLLIAVSNVSVCVPVGCDMDEEARRNCTSRYNGNGTAVRTMLPRGLSDDKCSLLPNKDRQVVVVEVVVGEEGEVVEKHVRLNMFRSFAKLAYHEVGKAIDGTHAWKQLLTEPMRAIHVATDRLYKARKARGSIACADPNLGMVVSEEGNLESVPEDEFVGHVIVQEAMIVANAVIAEFAAKNNIPAIYRNHSARIATPPRADVMAQIEGAALLPTPHLLALIERVDVLLGRAQYDGYARGHYALCMPVYTHCTSPIRRYADLVTQRQIVAFLRKERLPYTQAEIMDLASHINATLDRGDDERREYAKAKARSMNEARVARAGWRSIPENDFEAAIRAMWKGGMAPTPEFVDDTVRRIKERSLTHRSVALLLPSLGLTAVWEHAAVAVCEWFAKEPQEAVSIMGISRDLGLWTCQPIETLPATNSQKPCVGITASLVERDQTTRGPRCFASAQKVAWHRSIAAAVISRLGGDVPSAWTTKSGDVATPTPPSTTKSPISILEELARNAGQKPVYSWVQIGPVHRPEYVCTVQMGPGSAEGRGRDKQQSKAVAAQEMITKLGMMTRTEAT